MLKSFMEVVEKAKQLGKVTVSVAVAQDKEVLAAIKDAHQLGMVNAILVGNEEMIKPMAAEVGLPSEIKIIHEPDDDKAALIAASIVRNGEAQVLMKGLINTTNYLRAALNAESGLRSGNVLFHFAAFEIPGEKKLVYVVDGGMNIAPSLEEKKQMLITTVKALNSAGVEKPNVAVLAANEQVHPKMQATIDAKALTDMYDAGEFPPCVVEGPIAMDVATSQEAAKHKGIKSKISGEVDIYLVPYIEVGNILGKSLEHYAKAKTAGIILGATHPMVLTSRSNNAEAKVNAIALACLLAKR